MRRQPLMHQEPPRLVFIDGKEDGKGPVGRFPGARGQDERHALRGRTPVGERLYGTAPFGKCGTQTFIAGLTQDALIAP